jgi:cytoskeletal protein RodZ
MNNLSPMSEGMPMRGGGKASRLPSSRRRAHGAFPSESHHARRRFHFKLTVSAVIGAFVIGWLALLKHTVSQGPPARPPTEQDAARADIVASLVQIREEFKKLPSLTELISQLNAKASTTETMLTTLATKIAGQATSTATSTPPTAPSAAAPEALP